MPHHIVITGGTRESVVAAYLFPNTETATVMKHMAQPITYTSLFSLSDVRPLKDPQSLHPHKLGDAIPNGLWLTPLARRPPYLPLDNVVEVLHSQWLGQTPESIEGELEELIKRLQVLAVEVKQRKGRW